MSNEKDHREKRFSTHYLTGMARYPCDRSMANQDNALLFISSQADCNSCNSNIACRIYCLPCIRLQEKKSLLGGFSCST